MFLQKSPKRQKSKYYTEQQEIQKRANPSRCNKAFVSCFMSQFVYSKHCTNRAAKPYICQESPFRDSVFIFLCILFILFKKNICLNICKNNIAESTKYKRNFCIKIQQKEKATITIAAFLMFFLFPEIKFFFNSYFCSDKFRILAFLLLSAVVFKTCHCRLHKK